MKATGEIVWGSQNFTNGMREKWGSLRIRANSLLRVLPGVVVDIECEVLTFDGDVSIDCHGNNGRDGHTPPDLQPPWTSGPPEDKRRATENYLNALRDMHNGNPYYRGGNATPGTDGENGGTLLIRYHHLGADSMGGIVHENIKGGKGGAYASGGRGRQCINGANNFQSQFGPSGDDWGPGQDGRDGTFKLERIS